PIGSRRRCSAWSPWICRPRDRTIFPPRLGWPCRPADPCKPAPALWSDRPSRPAHRQRGGRVALRMPQAKGRQAARRAGNFAGSRSFGSLQGQDHRLTYSRARGGRERIAKKHIELAKNGELNRAWLYEAVLKEYYQHL